MSAPQATLAPPDDRRVAPRFQPAFGTVCRFRPNDDETRPAVGLVWNISQTGISMLMADPPKRGTVIPGELGSESGGPGLPITLRVMHVRALPTGDFFLGAQFGRPLANDEMRPFLAPPPRGAENEGLAS